MTLEEAKKLEPEQLCLDFSNNNIKSINVKQLDTKSRYILVSCTKHGKKIKLDPSTSSVLIACKKPDGYYVLNNCEILEDGSVFVELTQQMLAIVGKCVADIIVFSGELEGEVDVVGLLLTDDGVGNVTITGTNDIIKTINDNGLSLLTTMSFFINVLPSVIANSQIESKEEFNAMVDGLLLLHDSKISEKARQENEIERIESENNRKENETSRIANENIRIESENERIETEIKRQDNITGETYRIANEQQRVEAEVKRQTGEFGETYRQENEQLRIEAENKRQDSVTGEAYRIANEQQRIQTFNEKIEEYDQTIEDKISEYDEKVETVLADSNIVFIKDIANNLDTEEEGMVLDATQGKVLNDNIKVLKDNVSNQNLFINGNFVISSNAESFEIYGTSNEESYTRICDKWCAKHYDLENNYYITREGHGSGIRIVGIGDVQSPCYIFQILDTDIFNSIVGKTVTLSWSYTQSFGDANHVEYETLTESEQIFVDYNIDLETFTTLTRIGFESGVNGCVVHWIKLEVGELQTKYIPDSKDAIICKLERRIRKTMHLTLTDTVSAWGNVNLNIEASKYIVKSIYNSDNIYIVLPYVSSSGKWSANIRTNSYGSTDFVCPVGETITLEVYYEEIY